MFSAAKGVEKKYFSIFIQFLPRSWEAKGSFWGENLLNFLSCQIKFKKKKSALLILLVRGGAMHTYVFYYGITLNAKNRK